MTRAFVFPGQGSQSIGMGLELYEQFPAAKSVFDEVDEALSQHLSKLMFSGDEADLTLTENAQPALMAVSVAVARVLAAEFGMDTSKAQYAAGHSLGEYSAHAVAGTFSLADTARLLRIRGQAMQRAVPLGVGSMAALIGAKADMELAEAACLAGQSRGVCVVANDNNVGQIVISGHKLAVEAAMEKAKALGAKAMLLNVSAPFHCPLMAPAAEDMAEALSQVNINEPDLSLIANVTAQTIDDNDQITSLLVQQVTGRVRWRESVLYMANDLGVTQFCELGAGKVLSGMIKRLAPESQSLALNGVEDFKAFSASINS